MVVGKSCWVSKKLLAVCVIGFVSMFLTLLTVEFMVGCGEKTYHKDRTWETNACVFLPHEVKRGEW
jgi:hypothetical protein|tara:strand:+ start:763 stop:960 length:198 start_codon:yes stop_codon:yes gene_type:complete